VNEEEGEDVEEEDMLLDELDDDSWLYGMDDEASEEVKEDRL
jgi:hypothetical protein